LFQKIRLDDAKIAGIISPEGDGNCGFRAVSLAVYGTQAKWTQVKKEMLTVFKKYHDNLYSLYKPNYQKYYGMLSSTEKPCTNLDHWFNVTLCPQIVADTYKRPVVAYITASYINTHNQTIEQQAEDLYLPLCDFELENKDQPIILFLYSSHFYLVERSLTPNGKHKKIQYPQVNCLHKETVNQFPKDCTIDYSLLYN
jgi:hypothetical protein